MEHIPEQYENVTLVEIDPDGACYLNAVFTFLNTSVHHTLSHFSKGDYVYLGKLCLSKMQDKDFVIKMLELYWAQLSMSELVWYDDGKHNMLELTLEDVQEIIAETSEKIMVEYGQTPQEEQHYFMAVKLSSIWDEKISEFFFPVITLLLNIELLVWVLQTDSDSGGDRLIVTERFNPNVGSTAKCIDTCNVLICETKNRCSHYQLLVVTPKNLSKVIDLTNVTKS